MLVDEGRDDIEGAARRDTYVDGSANKFGMSILFLSFIYFIYLFSFTFLSEEYT